MRRKQKGGTEERQKTGKCVGRRAGRNKKGVLARIKDIPAVLVLRVYPYVGKEVTMGRKIM